MNARDILSRKGRDVVTIDPTATLAAAVKLLGERHIGALIITGPGGSVDGIISERDIVRALNENGTAVLAFPVSQVMTNNVEPRAAGPH
jgi:CBS domain-containing protein